MSQKGRDRSSSSLHFSPTGHKLESSHKAELKVGKHMKEEEKEVAKKEDAERSPEGLDSEAEGDEEEEDEEEQIKHWNRIVKMTEKSSEMGVGSDDTFTAGEQPMAINPSHHSKEDSEEQIQELQMMARREPTERREDDGSGSRKAEVRSCCLGQWARVQCGMALEISL